MTTKELRQKYLDFFKSKGHEIIPSASLIPENDATVLFTMAGMHPLVPFLMGEKHASGTRLVDSQKCIRTGDIEDVGDNRHLTFFEMLGNWSLGDYFKKEAIEWSWEFLTSKDWLGLDPKRIYITVFQGDDSAPLDEESVKLWQEQFAKVNITAELDKEGKWTSENVRIFALPAEDNWWGLNIGPCGPCSEMFYDTRPEEGFTELTFDELVDNGKFFEVWNDVFMEFDKDAAGKLTPLEKKNVDTGMGLERTVAVLNGEKEVFDIEEFAVLFEKISELCDKKYEDNKSAFRIVADHVRAAAFILGDEKGVQPSNVDQGYILRRLIRRAVRYGKQLGIEEVFTSKIAEVVIKQMADVYPELKNNKDFIINQLVLEEEKFAHTLENGLKQLGKLQESKKEKKQESKITGEEAFDLFSTYGFPLEMTKELAGEQGLTVDEVEFEKEFVKHQELSRAGAEQKFKGGLADQGESTTKLHTATHLLQAALQQVLGEHIKQKGSNITPDRLRFDFTHEEKMTDEQKKQVEDLVNDWIKQDLQIVCEEIPYMDAKERGVVGLFEDKYGDVVKVFSIGDVSAEMCGGPHVEQTGDLGHFKIRKEESSSAGVRRIKAILE
ncbi:alanine--tRNA ligase [Candidatus Falkowbacteria bacterium]|jgi:alanyl-tRNA synthetase|nr:alanine--tRNA ligase [Candidatus Falkowbacteria bacterium]MBT5502865.1 alanine--tRNA ligase [Candidatus Falkowbacteria bacterium]MBT6573628.1 alanine--tRNA ligase [Candidatus Falkowbacteria bacterium]MBT7349146.1 alanine--tRNA ligase [Candidatus Falkowbacteria bacterium]MBT7500099.1 alanine--tRNA ligase [Candidatus Falkowbacteria bacterium]